MVKLFGSSGKKKDHSSSSHHHHQEAEQKAAQQKNGRPRSPPRHRGQPTEDKSRVPFPTTTTERAPPTIERAPPTIERATAQQEQQVSSSPPQVLGTTTTTTTTTSSSRTATEGATTPERDEEMADAPAATAASEDAGAQGVQNQGVQELPPEPATTLEGRLAQLTGVAAEAAALASKPLPPHPAQPPFEMDLDLPQLRDYPTGKREQLFEQKLELCAYVFDFEDPQSMKKEKEVKRQTLLELVDFVNTSVGQKIFTEQAMPSIMKMVRANVCRTLPPQTEDYDPEEDEPVLEASWPHLQVVYEFFLRFVVSSEVNAKVAKKYVDAGFCYRLIELFDSEDPRERDYLKTILHRIYGKFMSHRSFIRKTISNVFYRFVYETERHNGVGELLEILGSIINGFAIPLKREHLQFLQCALIPLHVPKCVTLYHQQLSYCVIQFVEKDPDTAVPILKGLIKYWPWSSSSKQVLVMNELEEILELLGHEPLLLVRDQLFELIRKCLSSDHFQVTERTLFLWNNDQLVNHGCLSKAHAPALLPVIYTALVDKAEKHWNATVESLATNVLKVYQDFDIKVFNQCKDKAEELAAEKLRDDAKRQAEWEQIYALAAKKQAELDAAKGGGCSSGPSSTDNRTQGSAGGSGGGEPMESSGGAGASPAAAAGGGGGTDDAATPS